MTLISDRNLPISVTQLHHECVSIRLRLFCGILLDMETGNSVVSFRDLADDSRNIVWTDSGGDVSQAY